MKKYLILTGAALCAGAMLSAAQPSTSTETQYQPQPYKADPNFKPTPHAIMDDEIAKNVHNILAATWISNGYPNVTFDVKNGLITFRGIVDKQEDKLKIEQAARKIEGFTGLKNEITVGLPKTHTAMNNAKKNGATATINATDASAKDSALTDKDHAINAKIREKLGHLKPIGYETIVIATANGVVTITGNLERVEDMQRVSNEAKRVDGVKSVTNNVTARSHR